MVKSKGNSFLVRFTEAEWDRELGGWKSSVIRIPGVQIEKVFNEGTVLSNDWFELNEELEIILWQQRGNPAPEKLAVQFRLTKELSTQEATDKATDKWKKLAIFIPIIVAIVSPPITETTKRLFGSRDYSSSSSVATPISSPSTPTPAPAQTPTPEPKNKFEEKAKKRGTYLNSTCGRVVSRPVYPIFIPSNRANSDKVVSEFCKDARDLGDKIIVASFSEEEEANEFLEFIKKHFKGAWRGEAQ